MHTRNLTPYALVAILAISTIAAAEGELATSNTFGIHVDPSSAAIKPGGSFSFRIYVHDERPEASPQAIDLSIARHSGDGWRAAISYAVPDVTANASENTVAMSPTALLIVAPGDNATRTAAYEIVASDAASGEKHAAYVKVELVVPTPTPEPTATFALVISPDAQVAKPGSEAVYRVLVKARDAITVKLGVGAHIPEGFVAKLDDESLTLAQGPCATSADAANAECGAYVASTALRVAVPDHPGIDGIPLEVYATNGAGERHAAHAKLGIAHADGKPIPSDNAILARLHELEERVRALELREKELSAQLRLKDDLIKRLAGERSGENASAMPYALTGGELTLRATPYGGWHAVVTDGQGHTLGGNARMFLLMEVAGGMGPGER